MPDANPVTPADPAAQARHYIAAWSKRADDCGRVVGVLSDLLALVTTAQAERDAVRRGPMDPLRFANAEHEAEHWRQVGTAALERVAELELEDARAGPHIDRLVEMGDRLRERVAVLEPRVARLEAGLRHDADEDNWVAWPGHPDWPPDWYCPPGRDRCGYDVAQAALASTPAATLTEQQEET